MSHFLKCPFPRLLSSSVSSLPRLLTSQVGGTKTWGEEAREGIDGVQTEKNLQREQGLSIERITYFPQMSHSGCSRLQVKCIWRAKHQLWRRVLYMFHEMCKCFTFLAAAEEEGETSWSAGCNLQGDAAKSYTLDLWNRNNQNKTTVHQVLLSVFSP